MVKKDGMILELLIIRIKINTMNIVKTNIEGVLIIEPRLSWLLLRELQRARV